MLWRRLSLVRAFSAASLLSGVFVGASHAADLGQTADSSTDTVKILDARKSGELKVDLRGGGQGKALMSLTNTSTRLLNIVIPPGLVGANATAQGRGGQSVGLGPIGTPAGGFGGFQAPAPQAGFRSVGVSAASGPSVTVPAGQTVDLTLSAVCLNYGLKTPTAKDKLELVDVEDYTRDPRVRKGLRSLATYGTSFGVAQAAIWNIANGLSFDMMAEKVGTSSKGDGVMNLHEIGLASRFVEAIDGSATSDLVDPATIQSGRVFVTVEGQSDASRRLLSELEGLHVLGLPVKVLASTDTPTTDGPALHLSVVFNANDGKSQGKILVRSASAGEWTMLGALPFSRVESLANLSGTDLAATLDRTVASAFVRVKPAKKASGAVAYKVENRLPFTVFKVIVKSGDSTGASRHELAGLAVGPGRSSLSTPIAASDAVVDRVELNGL